MASARSLNRVELLGLVKLVVCLDGVSNGVVFQVLLVEVLIRVVELCVRWLDGLAGFVLVRRVEVAVALANRVSQGVQVTLLIKSWVNDLREITLAPNLLGLSLHLGLLMLH